MYFGAGIIKTTLFFCYRNQQSAEQTRPNTLAKVSTPRTHIMKVFTTIDLKGFAFRRTKGEEVWHPIKYPGILVIDKNMVYNVC